jgi:hypothetical protein
MPLRHFSSLIVLMQLCTTAEGLAADIGGTVFVPFVGCPGTGQVGPAAPPSGDPVPPVDVAPAIGAQLAYYKGANGPGVFAPAGWHCRQWYGSNGSIIAVTPAALPDSFPPKRIAGPGVEVMFRFGDTSGRFEVAEISARFFPDTMRDFVRQVRAEQMVPDSEFNLKPYSNDAVKRIDDRMVEFATPPRRAGFGTEGLLQQSDEPITGIVALNPPTEDTGLSVLWVRLRAGQESLSATITGLEAKCLRRPQGC